MQEAAAPALGRVSWDAEPTTIVITCFGGSRLLQREVLGSLLSSLYNFPGVRVESSIPRPPHTKATSSRNTIQAFL
eukprot:scaffold7368_cov474-Pinguiococcus_pyrenoidosus.AAC.1